MRSRCVLLAAVLALAPATLAICVALPAVAAAAAADDGAAYPPPAVRPDQASVLGEQTCARVTEVLQADERATSHEIALVVVRTTGGVPIERWARGCATRGASASGPRTTGCYWW
jgi:uncharacterized membrane protein YgcG